MSVAGGSPLRFIVLSIKFLNTKIFQWNNKSLFKSATSHPCHNCNFTKNQGRRIDIFGLASLLFSSPSPLVILIPHRCFYTRSYFQSGLSLTMILILLPFPRAHSSHTIYVRQPLFDLVLETHRSADAIFLRLCNKFSRQLVDSRQKNTKRFLRMKPMYRLIETFDEE